ncbi:MAG: hypothetical protein ABIJ09_11285 [Pseudomonadota bacterium]
MHARLLSLGVAVSVGFLCLWGWACTGPCDKACEVVVEACGLRADSVAQAPDGTPRGCRDAESGRELDLAVCLEQCQEWKAEGAECLAGLSCQGDAASDSASIRACLDGTNREHQERDGTDQSDCRRDCDRQASACGDACTTSPGDSHTCAGCFDNCDKSRARCRGWCKFIGQ